MIDGMDATLEQVRDKRYMDWQIVDASGWHTRTPRSSVVAHGQEAHDEHGHPVGTRVSLRFLMSGGSLVSSTASSSGVLMSDTAAGTLGGHSTITVYMPATETGTYVSDHIVDDVKFNARLMQTTWVPPSVRHRRPYPTRSLPPAASPPLKKQPLRRWPG